MEEENKKLDQFTKEIIQEAGLSTPSIDFLANVMAEVSREKSPSRIYKPLISKAGWLIIASLFLVFAFVLTRFSLGFSILGDWDLSSLVMEKYEVNFDIPVTYVYCSIFLLIFVMIQVTMIGKQFSRSLES